MKKIVKRNAKIIQWEEYIRWTCPNPKCGVENEEPEENLSSGDKVQCYECKKKYKLS